jgi:hypothetical protein
MPAEDDLLQALGAKDESFASVMRALALKLPSPHPRKKHYHDLIAEPSRRIDHFQVSDFVNGHPLSVLFEKDHGIVEIEMMKVAGSKLPSGWLPDYCYLRYANDKGLDFPRRRLSAGRDNLSRCNWFLPYILRQVLEGAAE